MRKGAVLCAAMAFSACSHARAPQVQPPPQAAARAVEFVATAYCQNGVTHSGAHTRRGVVAADPAVLPVGSKVRVGGAGRYGGVYTVLDTGAAVKGRHIDIFEPSCARAKAFGRRTVRVELLR